MSKSTDISDIIHYLINIVCSLAFKFRYSIRSHFNMHQNHHSSLSTQYSVDLWYPYLLQIPSYFFYGSFPFDFSPERSSPSSDIHDLSQWVHDLSHCVYPVEYWFNETFLLFDQRRNTYVWFRTILFGAY